MNTSLKCENCGEVYILGKDAMCLTSEELGGMMGALVGQFPKFLLVSHPKESSNQNSLASDQKTIMQLGPKRGWECEKCKHKNKWNPAYSKALKGKSWWQFWK